MEDQLLANSSVRTRLQKICAKNGSHGYMRSLLMGALIPAVIIFNWAYIHIRFGVNTGELPWYTADVFIVSISTVEVIVAPFLSWVGYSRRRTMLMVFSASMAAVGILVLLLPNTDMGVGTELCTAIQISPIFIPAAVRRLVIVTVICLMSSLSVVVVWSHGIAYMDEHNVSGMSMNYGILVVVRVLALILVPKTMDHQSNQWWVVGGLVIGSAIQALQYLKVPERAPVALNVPEVPNEDRGLGMSFSRMLTNKLALAQTFAMAFLAAGLWGFAFHQRDVVRELYHMEYSTNWMGMYADVLRYHFVVLAVVMAANKFSEPYMEVFSKTKAIQVATVTCLVVAPIYISAVAVFRCDKTEVAGLAGNNYTQPACSLGCSCSPPFNNFAPVCLVERMVTYLSPCHAGCMAASDFNGTRGLSDCMCGVLNQRAIIGPCNTTTCVDAFDLHKLGFLLIVIFVALAFQAQGVAILRAVDPRDRSITLGFTGGCVALITFIIGHMLFLAIRVSTCAWFEGGECQLHTSWFPYFIAAASASLTLIAFLINFCCWLWLRKKEAQPAKRNEDTPMEIVKEDGEGAEVVEIR